MVQKQAAYGSRLGSDNFADDDPLAELARIVGFEPPAARDVTPADRRPLVAEEPPAINLEDELLREFEVYDAPQPVSDPDTVAFARPSIEESIPFLDSIEQDDEYELRTAGANKAVFQPSEPVADEAEAPREAHGEAEHSVTTDLADELELAVADVPAEEPRPSVDAASRLKLPLANFHAPQSAVVRDEPSFDAAPAEPIQAVAEPVPDFGLVLQPVETRNWLSGPGSFAIEPSAGPSDRSAEVAGGFDDFTASAFDYAAPGFEQIAEPAARAEPDFSFSFVDELAASEEPDAALQSRPQGTSLPGSRMQEQQEAAAISDQSDESEPFDLFADDDFEIKLDDIDLDFSDLEEEIEAPAPVVQSKPVIASAAPEPFTQAPPMMTAIRPAPAPMAAAESALPFDPTEISEQDDHPESIAAMEVPEIPVHEPNGGVPFRPDYDLDIDTELASLFDEPRPAVAPSAAPSIAASQSAPAQAAHNAPDDFDAFERALEHDLQRSFEASKDYSASVPKRTAIPQNGENLNAGEPRSSRRMLVAASVAAVVVAVGAGGIYAWMSGTADNVLTSGEPPVIVADKDPVKIVPEDKGGQSVPNQDKAVYDRVEGAVTSDPKQESLISSSENPVDVVQKTLIPEMPPLEGESEADVMGTPVGETNDPRLLPNEAAQQEQASAEPVDNVTITPRKVRTMIVRPDGTLVAQELPAEPPAAPEPAPVAPGAVETVAAKPALAAPTEPAPNEPAMTAPQTAMAAATTEAPTEVAKPVDTAKPAASAPVPTTRPADQPVNVVNTVTDQGNIKAPGATVAVPPGGYVIQIASLPSEAEAQKSYKNLSAKYANVIGGRGVEILKADIAGKGTYYRVRIPAGSKADAIALCESYRKAGGSCLVAK
ncbi:MAG: SPOR domain-containing protein [Rhizobium sp.]